MPTYLRSPYTEGGVNADVSVAEHARAREVAEATEAVELIDAYENVEDLRKASDTYDRVVGLYERYEEKYDRLFKGDELAKRIDSVPNFIRINVREDDVVADAAFVEALKKGPYGILWKDLDDVHARLRRVRDRLRENQGLLERHDADIKAALAIDDLSEELQSYYDRFAKGQIGEKQEAFRRAVASVESASPEDLANVHVPHALALLRAKSSMDDAIAKSILLGDNERYVAFVRNRVQSKYHPDGVKTAVFAESPNMDAILALDKAEIEKAVDYAKKLYDLLVGSLYHDDEKFAKEWRDYVVGKSAKNAMTRSWPRYEPLFRDDWDVAFLQWCLANGDVPSIKDDMNRVRGIVEYLSTEATEEMFAFQKLPYASEIGQSSANTLEEWREAFLSTHGDRSVERFKSLIDDKATYDRLSALVRSRYSAVPKIDLYGSKDLAATARAVGGDLNEWIFRGILTSRSVTPESVTKYLDRVDDALKRKGVPSEGRGVGHDRGRFRP